MSCGDSIRICCISEHENHYGNKMADELLGTHYTGQNLLRKYEQIATSADTIEDSMEASIHPLTECEAIAPLVIIRFVSKMWTVRSTSCVFVMLCPGRGDTSLSWM